MAAAQAERETALRKAEEAQRKRATMARIRNIALVAVSILALLAGWLGWRSEQQRKTADNLLFHITKIIMKVQLQMDTDTKNEVSAIFQMGAKRGSTTSMRSLGELYQNGQGVPQDYVKAREWYELAADMGDANAMVDLGLLYFNGLGVPQDYPRRASCTRRPLTRAMRTPWPPSAWFTKMVRA